MNHSLHSVDPTTGVHTHNADSYWLKDMLPSYLDSFMWRHRHGLLRHVSEVYSGIASPATSFFFSFFSTGVYQRYQKFKRLHLVGFNCRHQVIDNPEQEVAVDNK